MLQISKISIKNFCSCVNTQLALSEITGLVGYNNAGKSNILTSIRWLIRPFSLKEKDFNDCSESVQVTGEITGLSQEVLQELNLSEAIEPFLEGEDIAIRRVQKIPDDSVRNIELYIRSISVNGTKPGEENWRKCPKNISGAIKNIFPDPIEIKAMDDAAEDVGKTKSTTTIGKLISEVVEPIEKQHGTVLKEALEGIRRKLDAEGIERAPELEELDRGANEQLSDIFPGLSLRVHVPPPDVKDFFKNGTIKVFEGSSPIGRDVESLGHGAQRSIQVALIRYLAEVRQQEGQSFSCTLLLIDEPELYLHPHAIEQIRLALNLLSKKGYQVVFTTHSPQMLTEKDIRNTIIVYKDLERRTRVRTRLVDAIEVVENKAKSQLKTLFELSNSSQILFSDRVLLIEGKTETRLLPTLYESCRRCTLASKRIAIVSIDGSGGLSNGLKVLKAMGIPCKALADLDYAFQGGVKAKIVDNSDEAFVSCRKLFEELSKVDGRQFNLCSAGLPTKKGSQLEPNQAYEQLAKHPEAKCHIEALHRKMKNKDIWLWRKGTMESHLGIPGKGEDYWFDYITKLSDEGFETVVEDTTGVVEFFDWIEG